MLPRLRLLLRAIRRHPRLRAAQVRLAKRACERRLARHPGVLAIDLDRRAGMGAMMANALLAHWHAERHGLQPMIVSRHPLYAENGEDVLARWFRRPPIDREVRPLRGLARDYFLWHVCEEEMSLDEAEALFGRYFAAAPELEHAIAAAAGSRTIDLSVHYRGTDKVAESGFVPAAAMFDVLDRELGQPGGEASLFVASDEPGFVAELAQRYPKADILTYDLGEVPPGIARHFSSLPPADRAKEALVNIMLLGRAPLCVRTSSALSAISRIAAPGLRTITVNISGRSHAFPEAQILAEEAAGSRQARN